MQQSKAQASREFMQENDENDGAQHSRWVRGQRAWVWVRGNGKAQDQWVGGAGRSWACSSGK